MTRTEILQTVAEQLDRNEDTIRGWIKSGHASILDDGKVTLDMWAVANIGKTIKVHWSRAEWLEGRVLEQNQNELAFHEYVDLAHLLRFYGHGDSPSVREFLNLPSWERPKVIDSMRRRVDAEKYSNDR